MKKFILIALTVLSTLSLSAQRPGRPAHFRNVYTQIDSLVVENFPIMKLFNKNYDMTRFVNCREKDRTVIKELKP